MKNIFLFLFLLDSLLGLAQKIPKFGKPDMAELRNESCSYDKDAKAEILLDEGFTRFQWSSSSFFKMITERRIRIKIYHQNSLDLANIKLVFLRDDHYEKILDIAGYTYTLVNDKIQSTKLDKDLIYTQKINDQFAEIKFTFPNVTKGSVIEYRYTTIKESFSNIDPWYFQGNLPVKVSSFTLQIPEYFRFTSKSLLTQQVQKKESTETVSNAISNGILKMSATNFTYILNQVPSLKREPFMSSLKDYLQRIEFQLSEIITPNEQYNYTTDWETLAEELRKHPLFGEQIKKNIHVPEWDQIRIKNGSVQEKTAALYSFFKKNFHWNQIDDFYALDLKKTAAQKSGSSGELNLLFLNLLRANQIESYPLLISTKENGAVNMEYPFLKQFNSVNCYIPVENAYFIINAADPYNSSALIPQELINTNALQILKDTCRWVHLTNPAMTEKEMVTYRAEISDSGLVNGTAYVRSSGYAKPQKLQSLHKDSLQFIHEYFSHPKNDLHCSNLIWKYKDADSLFLEQQFDFNTTVIQNGDYGLLYYNFFMGLTENPFTNPIRKSDIDFGFPRQYRIQVYLNFSPEYDFEELPGNITLLMPDTGIIFERKILKEDNMISISLQLQIKNTVYFADAYEFLYSYYQKLFELLQEPIVLLKKKK